MVSIRQILAKVFPKLRAIEENPDVQIIRVSTQTSSNPFDDTPSEVYDQNITVACIYSEQPEIVTTGTNLTTQQQIYFYIKVDDVPNRVNYEDRFLFNERRYRPVEIQELFGLWKVKVVKE